MNNVTKHEIILKRVGDDYFDASEDQYQFISSKEMLRAFGSAPYALRIVFDDDNMFPPNSYCIEEFMHNRMEFIDEDAIQHVWPLHDHFYDILERENFTEFSIYDISEDGDPTFQDLI